MYQDPINDFDPWGLVSAAQLGIGNPGSYGGENTCESMNDSPWYEWPDLQYSAELYMSPEDYMNMLPIGGIATKRKAVIKLGEKLGIYGKKIGGGGKLQHYSKISGKYVSADKTIGGKLHSASMSPYGQFTTGISQGLISSQSGGVAPPPAVTTLQAWGQNIGIFIGSIK